MTQAASGNKDQVKAVAAWERLLALCAAVFTVPSLGIFTDLIAGWALRPGRRT
ncbi:MAG: hypothetical protein ACRD0K_06100 [Egibacteraceae bacterium]